MSVKETLELDLTDAFAGLDRFGDQITGIADVFKDSLTDALDILTDIPPVDIPVTVDQAALDGISDTVDGLDTTVVIDADPTPAQEALLAIEEEIAAAQDLLDLAVDLDPGDATEVLEEVTGRAGELQGLLADLAADVDTSDAEAALDELTTAAGELSTQLSEVGDVDVGGGGAIEGIAGISAGLEGLTNVSSLGAESFGALAETLGDKLPAGAAQAVAGVGAVLVATQQLFLTAVDAEAAMVAFTNATGEFADEITNLNIAGLTGDLGELATKLGSDDEALLTVNQRIFQLGTSSGIAGGQVAQTAQQISVLAANAVALNPALGDVASVAQGLTGGLARGGRFLAQYGIALNSSEINARALADTQKTSIDQLTQYDKAAAGAALAIEKLGGSIKTNIEQGAKNPAIQLRSLQEEFANFLEDLGSSLPTSTIFDLLRTTLPLLKSVSTVVASVGAAVVPVLNELFKEITPLVEQFGVVFSESMAELSPALTELVQAFLRLNDPMQTLAVASFRVLPPLVEGLAIVVTGFADLLEVIEPAIAAADRWIRNLEILGINVTGAADDTDGMNTAIAEVPGVVDEAGGAAARAAGDFQQLQSAFLGVVDAENAYRDALDGIVDAQDGVRDAQRAVTDAQEAQRDAVDGIAEAQRAYEDSLRDIEDAERAQVDALDGVVEAQDRQRRSLLEVADAQQEVADAEAALAKARAGNSLEDDLAIREARLQLAEAERKVTGLAGEDAESAANRAALAEAGFSEAIVGVIADQEEATLAAEEREKAAIGLARAQLGLRDAEATAAGRVGEAEKRLADARERLTESQRAALKAARDVTDAQRAVGDAALRVDDANRKAAESQDRIADAQRDALDAAQRVAEAQEGVRDAVREVADAQADAARQAIAMEDTTNTLFGVLREAGPGGVDAYIGRLEDLKRKHPEVAGEIDNLIGRLRALQTEAPTAAAGAAAGDAFAETFLGKVAEVPPQSEVALGNGFRDINWSNLVTWFRLGIEEIGRTTLQALGVVQSEVRAKGTEIGQALSDAFNEKARDVFRVVDELVSGIRNGFRDAANLLYQTGRDILEGLLRGIGDRLDQIGGFLGDVKDRIVDGFKQVFGISSPAKSMMPIGEELAAGMAVGFESAAGDVVAVAEQIVAEAAGAMSGVQLNPQLSAGGGSGGGSVQVGQINMPMTFAAGTTEDQAKALAGAAMDGALDVLALRTAVMVS